MSKFAFLKTFVLTTAVLISSVLAISNVANAAERNANFDGLSKIIVRCTISTNRKFAPKICKRLVNAAETYAEEIDMQILFTGTNLADEKIAKNSQPTNLQLIIQIRGTKGRNPGSSTRITAGVEYGGAVEENSNGLPKRKGLLVLWERSVASRGPARWMAAGVSGFMAKKMEPLFDFLAKRKEN